MDGAGAVTIRDLVRNSLRMRPDRIIVGEVRGGEALDMLQAMNTGHEGSLTTVHANNAYDALSRMETLATMSDVEVPFAAIRDQVNSAIDLIVQLNRHADGSRRIVQIGVPDVGPPGGLQAGHPGRVRPDQPSSSAATPCPRQMIAALAERR